MLLDPDNTNKYMKLGLRPNPQGFIFVKPFHWQVQLKKRQYLLWLRLVVVAITLLLATPYSRIHYPKMPDEWVIPKVHGPEKSSQGSWSGFQQTVNDGILGVVADAPYLCYLFQTATDSIRPYSVELILAPRHPAVLWLNSRSYNDGNANTTEFL